MSSPSLVAPLLFLLLLFSSPSLVLSSSLSTIAVSFSADKTIVCALVDSYTLNCTSLASRRTNNYPAGDSYFAGIAGGDGFLCGLSIQAPSSHNDSVMRWWELPDNTTEETVKRLYKGPALATIGAGDEHVCGLTGDDRKMHCWRWPEFTPPNNTDLVDLAVGRSFVCALSSTGRVTCHGDCDEYGVVAGAPDGNYTTVAAGDTHACALSAAGCLTCWGAGAGGSPANCTAAYKSLALGRNRTCAVHGENDTVACWGDDGGFSLPARFAGTEFSSLTAKKGVFCGVTKSNFSLYCWGSDDDDEEVDWNVTSSTAVFDQVLPGPCVTSCPSVMEGSGRLCPSGTSICEMKWGVKTPPTFPPPAPATPDSTAVGNSARKKKLIYIVVGSGGLGMALVVLSALLFHRYCKSQCRRVHDSGPLESPSPSPLPTRSKTRPQPTLQRRLTELITKSHTSTIQQFPFQTLVAATDSFSDEKKIGSGGYGSVYRAVLGNREVAIKRADSPSPLGRRATEKENHFLAELAFLSRVNHRNLVRLLGFFQDEAELVLVYDYMANGSLHDHLHKLPNSPISSWKVRISLALDAARGLEYLHRYAVPGIIHRDIKSSNILLDDTWTAKVSDFGLSLVSPDGDGDGFDGSGSSPDGHVSFRAAGTVGYMDPEYYRTQCLTCKSDVYSFGVVLLELLTGCKAIHHRESSSDGDGDGDRSFHGEEPRNVVDFAVPYINADEVQNVLDRKLPLPQPSEIEAVQQLAYLAADCVRPEGRDRPDMTEVVYGLEIALDLCAAPPFIRSES